jgi:hypothetical protein
MLPFGQKKTIYVGRAELTGGVDENRLIRSRAPPFASDNLVSQHMELGPQPGETVTP